MGQVAFEDGIWCQDEFRHVNSFLPKIAVNQLAQRDLQEYVIPLNFARVHDAFHTVLPGTAADDDLALVGGTLGTNAPSIQTGDLKAAGATTRYARFCFGLPPEYVAGETVKMRFAAGMITTAADTSATLDLQWYKSDEDNTVSADLCATDAVSINSTSFADKDFTITASTLSPGDFFDFRIAIAVNDGATATAVIGCVAAIKLLCDTQG